MVEFTSALEFAFSSQQCGCKAKKQLTPACNYVIVVKRDEIYVFFLCLILENYKTRGGRQMRTKITLACTECKQRNYNTTKDKKTHPDRMETKKYCRFCKTHTMHKETK